MRACIFLGLALAATTFADAEELGKTRDAVEAAALLRVVTANYAQPQRCEFDVKWDSYPVPSSLAQKYLGLTLSVDITASFEPLDLQQALDPNAVTKTAFCTAQDYASFLNERAKTDEQKPAHRQELTFPVFDKAHKTAILIITSSTNGGFLTMPGNAKRMIRVPEGATIAHVYRKSGKEWKQIATETLSIID